MKLPAARWLRGLAAAATVLTLSTMPSVAHDNHAPEDIPPGFEVDPHWPKALPNNWIFGQVAGAAVDRRDHIWIIHRPRSLQERQVLAVRTPQPAICCVAAPPVLVFDSSGNIVRS
jgi:hypothetical protein